MHRICVALVGLDRDEAVTIPSLHDVDEWTAYFESVAVRFRLFGISYAESMSTRRA
jgi:hypothetical protein